MTTFSSLRLPPWCHALILAALCALPGSLLAAGNAVEQVSVLPTESGVNVVVRLQKALARPPLGTRHFTPHRLTVTLPATLPPQLPRLHPVTTYPVKSMQLAAAGAKTRVTFNLQAHTLFAATVKGRELVFAFNRKPWHRTVKAADFRDPPPLPHQITGIDFSRGETGGARIALQLGDSLPAATVTRTGNRLLVELAETGLARDLQKRFDARDFGTPVQTMEAYTVGDRSRLVFIAQGAWQHEVRQETGRLLLEVTPHQVKDGEPGHYTGEKLSLNFQDVEIRKVLQVIADFTGLNVVASDAVTGNVTVRLQDVPWDQALDTIMRTRGLAKRQTGNVIWIAPAEQIQQYAEQEPLVAESFQIKYQNSDNIRQMLQGSSSGATSGGSASGGAAAPSTPGVRAGGTATSLLSSRGSLVIDPRTNTLFVRDTPEHIDQVRRLLDTIDVPMKQVMIEARIVEASSVFVKQLGVRLGLNGTHSGGRDTIRYGGSLDSFGRNIVNLPASLINGASPGSFAVQIANSAGRTLGLELSALEADGNGKTISNPRLLTTDRTQAFIKQGTEIPYTTVSRDGNAVVSFRDAVLELAVVPQITPDDKIIMDVGVKKDTRGEDTISGPAIDKKEIKTQVLVGDGDTLVIGGIYTQEIREALDKIPLLGDMPVIGGAFRRRVNSNDQSELLIFLTPRIIRDSHILR